MTKKKNVDQIQKIYEVDLNQLTHNTSKELLYILEKYNHNETLKFLLIHNFIVSNFITSNWENSKNWSELGLENIFEIIQFKYNKIELKDRFTIATLLFTKSKCTHDAIHFTANTSKYTIDLYLFRKLIKNIESRHFLECLGGGHSFRHQNKSFRRKLYNY